MLHAKSRKNNKSCDTIDKQWNKINANVPVNDCRYRPNHSLNEQTVF